MNIAGIAIKYRVVTLVLTALLCIGGLGAFQKMGRLEDPEFTIKDAQVMTEYPGASAQQVSEEVSEEIETAIQQMGQLKYITSTSQEGLSIVQPTMKDKYDRASLPQVWDELRRKVGDVQRKLPPGAKVSLVNDDFGDVYGVFFALYGDGYTYKEIKDVADTLRRELLLVSDVGKVAFYGEQSEAVYVEIARAKLAQLGLSPELIITTINSQNQMETSGKVRVDSEFVRIQPSGTFRSEQDIGDLLILQADGTPSKIRIRDIARVRRGYVDPPTTILRYDGHPAIGIGISTVQGGNVVRMGAAVKKRMQELVADIPVGIEIGVISDQGGEMTKSINNFLIGLAESVIIVIGVLMFAMGLRSGLLMGGVLLITVLGTFILMLKNGVLLERISLGALVVALGMLVDNAIVITEGILTGARGGVSREEAGAKIVKQTMWPLFGATVIAVLAFAAIGTSQDKTGEFCRSLYQVILYSLMLSWLLAITVTPLLGAMFLRTEGGEAAAEPKDPYASPFFRGYRRFLGICIRRRWLVTILTVAALAAAIVSFKYVTQSFFPPSTRPQFLVHYWLPQGVQIERTAADIAQLEAFVLKQEGVTGVASCIGQGALRFILTYTPENPNTGYGNLLVSVDDYKRVDGLMAQVDRIRRGEPARCPVLLAALHSRPGRGPEAPGPLSRARPGCPPPHRRRGPGRHGRRPHDHRHRGRLAPARPGDSSRHQRSRRAQCRCHACGHQRRAPAGVWGPLDRPLPGGHRQAPDLSLQPEGRADGRDPDRERHGVEPGRGPLGFPGPVRDRLRDRLGERDRQAAQPPADPHGQGRPAGGRGAPRAGGPDAQNGGQVRRTGPVVEPWRRLHDGVGRGVREFP